MYVYMSSDKQYKSFNVMRIQCAILQDIKTIIRAFDCPSIVTALLIDRNTTIERLPTLCIVIEFHNNVQKR